MNTREVDESERKLRARFRARLRFFRHAAEFVVLNAVFFLVDWATGGEGSGINWAQWVAGIWGFFLAIEFIEVFPGPAIRRWEQATAEDMARRETQRRPGA